MPNNYRIYDEWDVAVLENLPVFEKWQRPERCSVKTSVRKGLCRAMREVGISPSSIYAGSKHRSVNKLARAA